MKRIFLIIALLNSGWPLLGQTNGSVRLALLSETDELSAISDVLTAQLSRNPQIHLLERSEIEKVYREQQLSAGNRDYIKLGQILGADGLLLLERSKEGTDEFLHSRLVAVKTGILLASERFHWPLEDLTNWVAGFVNHLQPLLPKLSVRAGDAVPLSVVNLRSAFQTPEERELEHNLTFLAIESLSQERQVFVLERRRMQLLSVEKELGSMDESAFWNGSYLLDGIIDRDGFSTDKVTLNARLVPPQGRAPLLIEISGSRTNVSGIIRQLAVQVLDYLQVSSGATPWNPSDEAKQYEDEAQALMRIGEMYLAGRDAPMSAAKAWPWFTLAAQRDDAGASAKIAGIESKMTRDELNDARKTLPDLVQELTAVGSVIGVATQFQNNISNGRNP
jgi:TolB-like protein